jgi:hypothetical protein
VNGLANLALNFGDILTRKVSSEKLASQRPARS